MNVIRNKFIICMYRVKGCPMVHFETGPEGPELED
jgi:hypothetical protein